MVALNILNHSPLLCMTGLLVQLENIGVENVNNHNSVGSCAHATILIYICMVKYIRAQTGYEIGIDFSLNDIFFIE